MKRFPDFVDLYTLITVAETGSFRQASERLHLGQSAVSRRIQRLEDQVGVSLFERKSSGAYLTFAGSDFLTRSTAIFEDLKAAIISAQASGTASNGKLRIGFMTSFSNGAQRSLIRTYRERHPDIQLSFYETHRKELMSMLNHRTLDVAISVGEKWTTYADGLVLARAPLYLVAGTKEPWTAADRLNWDELIDANFIVSTREAGPDIQDYIVRRVTSFGRSISITRHEVSREGIFNLVGLGLGVTVVGDNAAGASYPDVVLIRLGDCSDNIPFSVVWRPENDNPALRRFISLARIEAKRNGVLS